MNCTVEEMLAAHLASTFRNGEVGFTGLATGKAASLYITGIPLAAMRLAQLTHAPDLTILFNGWCVNPNLSALTALPEAEYDNSLLTLPCEAHMTSWPGPWSHHRGEISFAFCSGAQVDVRGNVNCTRIGDSLRPKIALVGPIFVPEHMAEFGREYVMLPHHEVRSLVERVDCISGVGYPQNGVTRRALGLRGGGPCAVYTPKCIFAFRGDGQIYVQSIHPGISEQELRDTTGFDLGDLSGVPVTAVPDEDTLRLLRTRVDPNGMLLGSTLLA